jgi:hypothetical protein
MTTLVMILEIITLMGREFKIGVLQVVDLTLWAEVFSWWYKTGYGGLCSIRKSLWQ